MHMFAPTVEMADIVAQHSTNIYQYHFSTPGHSYHSIELNYVFGAPYSGLFADEMTVNGSIDKFSVAEKQLSLDVMKLWTSFARTGQVYMYIYRQWRIQVLLMGGPKIFF